MPQTTPQTTPQIQKMRDQLALITGATSGIGLAIAEGLAARGYDLIISGRRADRLREISTRLMSDCKVHVSTLAVDVNDQKKLEHALRDLNLENLGVLVNSAGLALGTDPMHKAKFSDWETMLDTNVKALLHVTHLCLPHLLKQKAAHIVNIGSVAGRWTYPGGGVYSATKFAVRAISDSLRLDLIGSPVRVTNIEPGMVETEFSEVRFNGDQDKAKQVYKGMKPLTPQDIADTVIWCLDRPQHVNIQELVIFPTDQAGVGPYVHRRR